MRSTVAKLVFAVALLQAATAIALAEVGDDGFAAAAGHYSARRWELAAEEFTKFLADHPQHAKYTKAAFFLGEALVQLGKFDEALGRFSVVLDLEPKGRYARQALFRAGECAFMAAKDDDARRSLTRFREQYRDDALCAYALQYLGELCLRAGDAGAAEEHYQVAIDQFPDGPTADDCRLGLAQAELALEQFDKATETLQSLLKRERLVVESHYWLGQVHKAQAHWQPAAEAFQAAIAADPEHSGIETLRYQAAESLVRAAKYNDAIELLIGPRQDGAASLPSDQAYLVALAHQGLDQHEPALETLDSLSNDMGDELAGNVLLAKATSLVALDRDRDAIQPLKAYLARTAKPDPSTKPRILEQLALCQARSSDFAGAKATLGELKTEAPQTESTFATMLEVAHIARRENRHDIARELYSAIAADPLAGSFAPRALSGLARLASTKGDAPRASSIYQQVLDKHPDDPQAPAAALALAEMREQREEYDAALGAYGFILDKHPKTEQMPLALLRAAQLHDRLNQETKAIELYQTLVADFSSSEHVPSALYGWAWCLRDLKQTSEANSKFDQLRRDHPTSEYWADATYRLAQAAVQAKESRRAKELATELVASARPDRKVPHEMRQHGLYLRAGVAISQAEWDDAEDDLKRLIKEYTDSSLLLPTEFLLADVAYRRGDYEVAGERFTALSSKVAERSDRWAPMIPLRRAQILAHQKHWSEARTLAEQIAKDYPLFEQQYEVDYLIGRCHAAEANLDKARQWYEKALQSPNGGKTETAAMAQWMIGETYFLQEQYAAAAREYLRVEVLYAFPHWQAAALLQAGKCYEQLGQWKDAGDAYSRLLRLHPQSAFAAEARERLDTTQARTASRNKR
jgi:TolA-binding protein